MEDAPNNTDTQELDEPTLPFTRKQIDRRLRAAEDESTVWLAPATATSCEVVDEDWFELDGRRIRVSLAALAHIGSMGTPANMLTSRDGGAVAGAFGPLCDVSRRRYWRLASVLVLLLTLGLILALSGLLTHGTVEPTAPTKPIEATVADAVLVPVHPSLNIVEPTPPITPAVTSKPEPQPSPPSPPPVRRASKGEAGTSACGAQRRDAAKALSGADWGEAESLTRSCWRSSRRTKVLRMRALFELDRLEECIELGEGDRSKEVSKWQTNCSRALQRR